MEIALGILIAVLLYAFGSSLFIVFATLASILIMFVYGMPIQSYVMMYFAEINNFTLVAAPLFVLAGNFMIYGGLSEQLVKLFKSFTGHISGGLALGVVIASAFVGALTGSALATLAAVGLIMFPAMIESGYSRSFSASILASSMGLGFLIPPSMLLIIYSFLTFENVSHMFAAGILPGLVSAAVLCIAVLIIGRIKNLPRAEKVNWKERFSLLIKSIPAILMPIVVLGGIYGGIFTPTEAAAVACVYTILVGILIYRKLNWKHFIKAVDETTKIIGTIFLLIVAGMVLGNSFIMLGLGQSVSSWFLGLELEPITFLLITVLLLTALGCIMEGIAVLVISIPFLMPVVAIMEIDKIHFGIIVCMCLILGYLTPPMSIGIYASSGLFNTPIHHIIAGIWPFLIAIIVTVLIIVFVPPIAVFIPSLL